MEQTYQQSCSVLPFFCEALAFQRVRHVFSVAEIGASQAADHVGHCDLADSAGLHGWRLTVISVVFRTNFSKAPTGSGWSMWVHDLESGRQPTKEWLLVNFPNLPGPGLNGGRSHSHHSHVGPPLRPTRDTVSHSIFDQGCDMRGFVGKDWATGWGCVWSVYQLSGTPPVRNGLGISGPKVTRNGPERWALRSALLPSERSPVLFCLTRSVRCCDSVGVILVLSGLEPPQ